MSININQCELCNEIDDEKFFKECKTCPRSFCLSCIDIEKRLKSPLLSKENICIWCRITQPNKFSQKLRFNN